MQPGFQLSVMGNNDVGKIPSHLFVLRFVFAEYGEMTDSETTAFEKKAFAYSSQEEGTHLTVQDHTGKQQVGRDAEGVRGRCGPEL